MSKVCFISGPIANGSHDTVTPRDIYQNVRRAEKIMFELMKKGWAVFCPHLSYHAWVNWNEDIPYETWINQDFTILKKCDAMFYMLPEIYGESKGAMGELEKAKEWGIPIYTSMDQVPNL